MDRSAVDHVFPPLRLLPVPVPHSVLDRPYFTDVVFPTGNIFVLDSMSCLGLIYYTFTVGVEIELPTVVRVGLQSFWFAAASSLRGPQHRRLPPEKGYSEAVNVVGFLYSVFQLFALAVLMRRKKHLIPRPKGDYFDFIMDQVLAYLLISSSSSATARVGDWIDNWGSDPFPNMANSSIAISFLAFLVFAISALISAYNLFRPSL